MKYLIIATIITGFLYLGTLGVGKLFETPTVYKSASSNTSWANAECVRVDDPQRIYSCDNLPNRYHAVWSK